MVLFFFRNISLLSYLANSVCLAYLEIDSYLRLFLVFVGFHSSSLGIFTIHSIFFIAYSNGQFTEFSDTLSEVPVEMTV